MSRPKVQVGLFAVLVLVALWSIVAYDLLRSREDALSAALRENESLTRTLRAHTDATLDAATLLLDHGGELIMTSGLPLMNEPDRQRFAQRMIRAMDPVRQVSGFGIFAADGLLRVAVVRDGGGGFSVVPSILDLTDRDYVQALVSLPGKTAFVGRPVSSRADGALVLPVSRPVRDMVGALTGGAVALINIETFVALFEAVRPAGNSQVSLVRVADEALLAGAPASVDLLGERYSGPGLQSVMDGGIVTRREATAEGKGHMVSAVSLSGGALRLIVATDLEAALTSWRSWRDSLVMISLGVSAAVLVLATVLVGQWRRRLRSEAELGRSRQALIKSMERFERAVAGATSALWEFDLVRGGGYFAPQWETMLGWRDVKDPYAHWRANLHPDDRDRVLVELDRHLDLRVPFDTEYRLRAADGSWRWVQGRGQASWDDAGRPLVISGMVHDITDLQRSEERLRLALEATDEGLWDWTIATDRMFMSARWKTLLGYAADQPFAYHWRTFLHLIRPQDRPQVLAWVRDMLAGRSDRWLAEFGMRRADGTWAWTRVAAKVTERDAEGRPMRVVGTLKDVSRRHEEQALLQAAKEQAELANRTKSEFLANMSHELRTPLNAISGFSESLESRIFGDLNPKQMEYVGDIRFSTEHLTALIGDILDMAKIESGRDELREEPVDVAAAIRGKMQMVRQRAAEKAVTLVEDLEPMPPYCLDGRKFGQMVLNIMSNAIKFTPRGGTVTLRAAARADGGLDVSVTDTGIGIAPEDLAKVWEPFHQVDSRLSRQYEGTGLGLPLVKAMAEMHGGTVDLHSTLGHGTTVSIHLPGSRRIAGSTAGAMAAGMV